MSCIFVSYADSAFLCSKLTDFHCGLLTLPMFLGPDVYYTWNRTALISSGRMRTSNHVVFLDGMLTPSLQGLSPHCIAIFFGPIVDARHPILSLRICMTGRRSLTSGWSGTFDFGMKPNPRVQEQQIFDTCYDSRQVLQIAFEPSEVSLWSSCHTSS